MNVTNPSATANVRIDLARDEGTNTVSGVYSELLDKWAGNNSTKIQIADQIKAQACPELNAMHLTLDNANEFDLCKNLPVPVGMKTLNINFTNTDPEAVTRNSLELVSLMLLATPPKVPIVITIDGGDILNSAQINTLQCQLFALQHNYGPSEAIRAIFVVGSDLAEDAVRSGLAPLSASRSPFQAPVEDVYDIVLKDLGEAESEANLLPRAEGHGEADRDDQVEGMENEFEPGLPLELANRTVDAGDQILRQSVSAER